MRLIHTGRAAVLLALAAVARPSGALEVPSEHTTWVTIRTRHFLVVSDTRRGRVHDVSLQLEQMVVALGQVAPLLVRSSLPTEAFLFSSGSSFEEYCATVSGRSCSGVSGLFVPGQHGNYLLISARHFDEARAAACHELAHAFVRNNSATIPLWLNEGLAEFYGSFSAMGNDIRIGQPELQHLVTLRTKGLLPLTTVLGADYESPEYTTPEGRPSFYAQSWLLTHYLLVGSANGRRQLTEYLTRTERGESRETAFQAAFGTSTAEFNKELYGYTQRATMSALRLDTKALAVPDPGDPRPLPRDEALAELAIPILDGSADGSAAARPLLEEARRVNPGSPLANALLASFLGRQGSEQQATALFEDAMRSPSAGVLPPLLFAEYLLGRAGGVGGTGVASDSPDVARARELLATALSREPKNVPALIAVGTSYLISPGDDPGPGIDSLERALALAPSRHEAAATLAQLLARAGQPERARETVQRYLLASPDPQTRARALELLAHVDVEMANVAATQRRYDDAAVAFEAALAATKDPFLQAQIRSRLKTLRDTRDYNAAVDLANHGDRAGALAALDRLIPVLDDPSLRSVAAAFRERLAAVGPGAGPVATAEVVEQVNPGAGAAREETLRRESQTQKEAERFNQAAALANRGELREALEIATDLAANASNSTVKNAAAGLRDRLRARLAGAR